MSAPELLGPPPSYNEAMHGTNVIANIPKPSMYQRNFVGRSVLRSEVSSSVLNAKKIAEESIPKHTLSSSQQHFPYFYDFHNPFYTREVHHHHYYDAGDLGARSSVKNDSDDALWKFIFAVATAATVYFIAQEWGEFCKGCENSTLTGKNVKLLSSYSEMDDIENIRGQTILKITNLSHQIANRNKHAAAFGISLKLALLVSTTVFGLGGLAIGSAIAVTVGQYGLGICSLSLLARLGYQSSYNPNETDAREIQNLAKTNKL